MNHEFILVFLKRGTMSHRLNATFRRFICALLIIVVAVSIASEARAQNLAFTPGIASTYAGDPTETKSESPATYVGPPSGLVMNRPSYITFDSAGNLYIVEDFGHILRVIAGSSAPIPVLPGVAVQAGNVYTVASNGGTNCAAATDAAGDGCPAAQFAWPGPKNIAVDAQGNIFFPDADSNEVRVIYAGGTIPELSNPVPGNVYAVYTPSDGYLTTTTLAVDGQENIYINNAPIGENDLLAVIYSGKTATGNPLAILLSTAIGSLYTLGNAGCSSGSNVCGDGGPIVSATYSTNIESLSVDASGNIYISDYGSFRLRVIYVAGSLPGVTGPTAGYIYTVAGNGSQPAATATYSALGATATSEPIIPNGPAAFDAVGNVYLTGGEWVYKVDSSGTLTNVFGGLANTNKKTGKYTFATCAGATDQWGDGCAATSAGLSSAGLGTPNAVAIDAEGNIYVADHGYKANLIRESIIANSALTFSGTAGISLANGDFLISNAGSQTLHLTGITFNGPFAQTATGGSSDCTSSTPLAAGQSCAVGVAITATAVGSVSGSVEVASNSQNVTSGDNTVALSGTLAAASTSTALTASPAYPTILNTGQQVTFTVTVTPQFGDTLVPSSTVTILNGTTEVGTGNLTNGVATVPVTSLPAGSLQITAQYNGDSNFNGSTSNYVPVQVSAASTAVPIVTLTSSSATAISGQSVTLTATVTTQAGAAISSGTVTFQEGNNPLGAAVTVNSSGIATFTTSTLLSGTNTLLAVFSGSYGTNTSNAVSVVITGGAQLAFSPGVIARFAGEAGSAGYSGDGHSALNAQLSHPGAIVADLSGNIYFLDQLYGGVSVVRVVASGKGSIAGFPNAQAGDIYTFAGNGTCTNGSAPCNDGGPATSAALYYPAGLAVDAFGNVFIADGSGANVREVNPKGVIQTIVGTLNGSQGYGGDGGPATSAQIAAQGLFVDNTGNLYIADGNNNDLIRRVDALTGIITTVAGNTAQAGKTTNQGNALNVCTALPCGDGGPATSAYFQASAASRSMRREICTSPIAGIRRYARWMQRPESSARSRECYNPRVSTAHSAGMADQPPARSLINRQPLPWITPATSTSPTAGTGASGR